MARTYPPFNLLEATTLRKVILALTLAFTLTLSGCSAMTSGSLTHKVTIAQHNFLQVVGAFQDAEIANFNQGLIPSDVHLTIQTIIQKIALGGKDLDQAVVSGSGAATIQAKVATLNSLLQSLQNDGLTGIKNPTVKATLQLALAQIQAVLDGTLIQAS